MERHKFTREIKVEAVKLIQGRIKGVESLFLTGPHRIR